MHVGFSPGAMAITADGCTAYLTNFGWPGTGDTVTPVNLATGQPGRPIKVGKDPVAITITPNGRIAYVSNGLSDTITPIRIR